MKFMASFVEFLERLLTEGTVVLCARPGVEAGELQPAERLLAAAYEDHRLDVAGPPIAFDASAALAAAEQLWFACWFLLHHGDPPDEIEKCLPPLPPPVSAAQDLSTDLVLRFAPQVQRRVRNLDPADILTKRLEQLLRRHPLSGVLADIEEGPLTPVRLGDHAGLQLLYAERLAEKMRPTWVPEGPALAYIEVVFAERGLPVPEPLPPSQPRQPS
jgi:MoxR-vWA-beta-propeller ternary system domain bpX4